MSVRDVTEVSGRAGDDALIVVGIGASAGGLEALTEFFEAMPNDSGMAFVVIQHLDPTRESLMVEMLSRRTGMPVTGAADGMVVEPNHVYMILPDGTLTIRDGKLRLAKPTRPRNQRHPVDDFFVSLAEDRQEKAICIVLSGTGSNGTAGLRKVKGEGGLTVAQLPETAKFDGMPRNAIGSGMVDLVLAPDKIPDALRTYSTHPYVARLPDILSQQEKDKGHLDEVLALLRNEIGHDFTAYRKATLFRRVYRRMGLNNIQNMQDYIQCLHTQPDELTALFRDLLINVTEFFRDPEAWKALEDEVIAPLVKARENGASIRVWSPACSTGEEAYSLAMLIADQSEAANKTFNVTIFATDAADDVLHPARFGAFAESIAAGIMPDRLQKYFVKEGDTFRVDKALRDMVVFAEHDLLVDPPFSHIDLICCRNLLIYLEPEAQHKAISLLHYALNENGYLFLGNGESVGQESELFEPVSAKWRIFKRLDPARHATIEFPDPQMFKLPVRDRRPSYFATKRKQRHGPRLARLYAPVAALIDKNNQVLYFHGSAGEFLTQSAGEPTRDVFSLAHEDLQIALRKLVDEVRRENVPATSREVIQGQGVESDERIVTVTVLPLDRYGQIDGLMLVTFEEQIEDDLRKQLGAGEHTGEPPRHDQQLQREFHRSTGVLQDTVEELEVANEELQSTNEELETSQEELQSLNEELTTANAELQDKVERLEEMTNDLTNLVSSTDLATLFLDPQLNIKWFAPAARDLFGLIESDIGRPISDLAPKFTGQNMLRDAQKVLTDLTPIKAEIKTSSDRWYMQRITPYRTSDNRIEGVVITFTDFTDLQSSRDDLAVARMRFDLQLREQTLEAQTERLRVVAHEVTRAEQRERKKLAEVLHDGLQQLLAATRMRVNAWRIQAQEDSGAVSATADEIEGLLSEAINMGRSLTFELYPPVLHKHGLAAGFEWLAGWMNDKYDLTVKLQTDAKADAATEELRVVVFQAVRELLFNVVKHSGVKSAQVQTSRTPDGMLRVEVEDHGTGSSAARRDGTTSRKSSGFGLSSIRERLKLMDGTLEIASKPGKGMHVVILAPALPVDDEDAEQPQSPTPKKTRSSRTNRSRSGQVIKVMLADDNDLIRQSVAAGLSRESDIEIVGEASDGQAAVEMAKELRPDVVMLDISMPVMTGIEATRLITAELPDVRVFGLSLYDDDDTVKQMMDAGASGFLSKAVSMSAIVTAIRG